MKGKVQNVWRPPFVSEVGEMCIFIGERINEKFIRLITSVYGNWVSGATGIKRSLFFCEHVMLCYLFKIKIIIRHHLGHFSLRLFGKSSVICQILTFKSERILSNVSELLGMENCFKVYSVVIPWVELHKWTVDCEDIIKL